jgi:MFS family permease
VTVQRSTSVIVCSGTVLGLAWLGDALIHVVMPLHAAAFGIGLPWVGVVLSVNRIVRIVGYGWIEPLTRRAGVRNVVIAGSGAAAISTLAYGLTTGIAPLLAARLLWGICWAVLNLLTTVYALTAEPRACSPCRSRWRFHRSATGRRPARRPRPAAGSRRRSTSCTSRWVSSTACSR